MEVFSYISLKKFFASFSFSSLAGTPLTQMLLCLMLLQNSHKLIVSFFNYSFLSLFFNLVAFHYLYSRSQIHSSASSNLLLIFSSVFFIYYCLDFSTIHSLLNFLFVEDLTEFMYSFLKSSEYLYDHYFKVFMGYNIYCHLISCPSIWEISISPFYLTTCVCFNILGRSSTSSGLEINGLCRRGPVVPYSADTLVTRTRHSTGVLCVGCCSLLL